MKILKTGHEIADTVAAALEEGLYGINDHGRCDNIGDIGSVIGYGILRGTKAEFKNCTANNIPWFHLDRGYFKPNHYDGYYRVSLNGTQQTVGLDKLEPDYHMLKSLNLDIKEWRGFDKSKPVLVCPPTEPVMNFFELKECFWNWHPWGPVFDKYAVIRKKGDNSPINFYDYDYVLTFNSSLGWQALQAGIPCVSDPTHSIVGSRYHNISLDNLEEAQYVDRHKLFAVMANLQLSLQEIRAGKICNLVERLLSLQSS